MSTTLLPNTTPPMPAPPSAEARLTRWDDIALEPLNPLIDRQLIVGDNIMISRLLLKKGAVVPEHSHLNEQVTYVVEGALQFFIAGREIVVRSGEVLTIPAAMPHNVIALEDTVDVDVFTPPRLDWIAKTDTYLRK